MPFSNYLGNAILNAALRNTTYTSPATAYLALYTSDPTAADVGTEVSGGSYARQSIAFDAASAKVTQNASLVTFPQASGSWGTITHFGIRDALTSGNLLFYAAFSVSKTITTADQLLINDSDISVTLA